MAVISARIDDVAKKEAEKIADSIGLSLSTVINVFLNRFIAERGFPFNVTDPKKASFTPVFQKSELEALVQEAIANREKLPVPNHFSFIDPENKDRLIQR